MTTMSESFLYKVLSVSVGTSSTTVGYSTVTYGTTSKEKAQTNTNNSAIKDTIDNWYETNILGTEYEQYISDTLFCNDRSVVDYGDTYYNYSHLAYGSEITTYRAYVDNGNKVTLKCDQQNDRFTVSDTTTGNGDLTYPIALITSDEVYLAGGTTSTNYNYYLYTGNEYWTMTPSRFNSLYFSSYPTMRTVDTRGSINGYLRVHNSNSVRPAINLKAGSLTKGTGVATDPYTVT